MKTMKYKGYAAHIEYSDDDGCFVGHIAGIRDVVGFHGESVGELRTAFEEGLLVFGAGRNPMKVRMLLPVNVTDEELEAGFAILEKALKRVAEERELPC